jgi:serine protease Do
VDSATAKALELPEAKGALVNSVLDGQPAAQAGIKEGDVILAINGKEIEDTEHLLREVALLSPGSTADIAIWRDGKRETVKLTVAERASSTAMGRDGKGGSGQMTGQLGLKLRPVTADDVQRYDLRGNGGLLVIGVNEDSLAAKAGIQNGDVILAVNKKAVNSVREFSDRVHASAKQRGAVLLHISRKGQIFFRAIELKK